MAAFIAGAAVVAVAMVVVSPAERAPPTLQEKLMMLKRYKAQALREQNNQMLDALGEPAVNGMCPGSAGDYIFQDGRCYKAHVCYLPTDIYCSKGVGACGDETTKTTCGSGADKAPCQSGVNYQAGWTLPQGCSSTCAVSVRYPWGPHARVPRRVAMPSGCSLRTDVPVRIATSHSRKFTRTCAHLRRLHNRVRRVPCLRVSCAGLSRCMCLPRASRVFRETCHLYWCTHAAIRSVNAQGRSFWNAQGAQNQRPCSGMQTPCCRMRQHCKLTAPVRVDSRTRPAAAAAFAEGLLCNSAGCVGSDNAASSCIL